MKQNYHLPRSLRHKNFLKHATKKAGTIYLDLTGRYPIISSQGNQNIFICYDYATNNIQAIPTNTQNYAEIQNTTISMISTLTTREHQPNIHILDNEASSSIKQGLIKNKIKHQLVPPHLHRRNEAKRAIQKFKAHFITCLCIANPKYPAKEWDSFLPQENLTLNLLRNFCLNPKLSSYAAFHGMFDYNKTPLSPLGTRVLVH